MVLSRQTTPAGEAKHGTVGLFKGFRRRMRRSNRFMFWPGFRVRSGPAIKGYPGLHKLNL